jgi:hypothetical protein
MNYRNSTQNFILEVLWRHLKILKLELIERCIGARGLKIKKKVGLF